MNQQPAAMAEFETELQAVHDMLARAAEELGSPLGALVRAQIKRAQPLVRAALVLTVAVSPNDTAQATPPDPASMTQTSGEANFALRERRIHLAAALEMLHVALNVHRLLVTAAMTERPGSDDALDRSLVGSTILAGDYCFSRAAQMAARTDHPGVVAIFAQALQNVSEGLLRSQFSSALSSSVRPEFDETRELLRSGAQAAGALVGMSESASNEAISHSQDIAARWATYGLGNTAQDSGISANLQFPVHGRWQILHQWLSGQRVNGKTGAPATNHTLFN